jgi:PmbA protein
MKQELYDAVHYAMDALTAGGADGVTISASRGQRDELNVEAGVFSLLRTTFSAGLGFRALLGGRSGVSSANQLDRAAIDQAVAFALDAARASEPDAGWAIAESIGDREFTYGTDEGDLDKLYDRCQEVLTEVKTQFPRIDISRIIASFSARAAYYVNSNGTRVRQTSASYGISVSFCARDGAKVSALNGYGYSAENLDAPILENAELRRLLAETERQLDPVPVQGKFVGKVLMCPDAASGFINSALSNCVSDGALIMGTSPWKDKIGETVADKRLNITINSLDERIVFGSKLTSDGFLAEPQEIIRDGELVSFALGLYGSRKTGLPRAKNDGSLIIGAGGTSYDDLLAGIEDGLLLNRFSGGGVAQNGEFSGVAKNSFLIKNGKIADAVSETMISGNVLDMLNNIAGISSDLLCDGSSVSPWFVFDGVTISGK